MGIPIEVVLIIFLLFLLRDIQENNKPKNNYDKGYRKALSDIADEWNYFTKKNLSSKSFLDIIHDYIQKKLE